MNLAHPQQALCCQINAMPEESTIAMERNAMTITITITILLFAIFASVWPAVAFVPLAPTDRIDSQVVTKIYYFRPYYASPY
jgi:hypothetical protein